MYSLTQVMELWIHLCSRLKMQEHLHQGKLCKKLPRNGKIEKMLPWGRKFQKKKKTKKIGQIFLHSMIRNHEQWVYSLAILTYWAVMYLRSSSSSCYLEFEKSLAAKLECCEIHERKWGILETFLIVNMLDEILVHYTMIQEFCRHHWRFWEQKELRIVGAKNHCNQYLHFAFQ